jgi:hypothetical protein
LRPFGASPPPSFRKVVAILVALLALLVTGGWGFWGGTGVFGDHALDLADALRVHQGDVPYRDFLPTYGPLYMVLVAPLFGLGRAFFPALWIASALLIAAQTLALSLAVHRRHGAPASAAFGAIFLACVAFAPINANWMQGYSPSGHLATLGWTAMFLLLLRPGAGPRRWLAIGAIAGLLPFTKMDLGLASAAVALGLAAALLCLSRRAALLLAAGFLATWLGGLALLASWAGRADLLVESALEGLGQASMFGDPTLKRRMGFLFGAGALAALALALPRTRPFALAARRRAGGALPWLLPVALLGDAWRGWAPGSVRCLVLLDWFWALVLVLCAAPLVAAVARTRSVRVLSRLKDWPALLLAILLSGMAVARVSITGWYPLNYSQPALLLLMFRWLAARAPLIPARRAWRAATALGVALALLLCARKNFWPEHEKVPLETAFGTVPVAFAPPASRDLARALAEVRQAPCGESILCTYEPSLQLFSGLRSAAFYTYFGRVGFAGKYQALRERQADALFEKRRPLYVFQMREMAVFSRFFGADHCRELAARVPLGYDPVMTSTPGSPMQFVLFKRRDRVK